MPEAKLISQPFNESLADEINRLAKSNQYNHFICVVAFAKSEGVSLIESSILNIRENGGTVDFFVGCDLDGTSYEAMSKLFMLTDNLYLVHSSGGQTFHPKLYNLVGECSAVLIVGSNNLTFGGLSYNAESSVEVFLSLDNPSDAYMQEHFEKYVAGIKDDSATCMRITSDEVLSELLNEGLLCSEGQSKQSSPKVRQTDKAGTEGFYTFDGRFGKPQWKAIHFHRSSTSDLSDDESPDVEIVDFRTLWIATGKGTGGSNNQLDLSKISVIAPGDPGNETSTSPLKIPHGTVEFFGVDPKAVDVEMTITIEFEGVRYYGNVIKIDTKSKEESRGKKKPNESWRLYFRGISEDDGSRILKGCQLSEKIAIFTRKDNGLFHLELVDDDKLNLLIRQSDIVAHNGMRVSNRMFGLINLEV